MAKKSKKSDHTESEQPQNNNSNNNNNNDSLQSTVHVQDLYKNWFLDYASYVILERAVPALYDGLKPVQRRILHAMKRMDDGRYHKVANIIGHTMQFHPHGDAAIGDALVNLGQKELLIDTQGNWGDIRTGDSAAAPRYIEARLSKFALEVAFNPDTTEWQLSYDGRQKEPVHLPMKFPLVLAQGAEGIAVGLSTKILPHNFNELIDATIQILKGKESQIFPDFPTGGYIDVTNYNDGKRGGRVRVRAKIEIVDRQTLIIRNVPYGSTTSSLIDSIIKANDNGKIKIKHVVDNTAEEVEILIELAPGVSPNVTIDALYAFTDCEISISPNCCVIYEDRPRFMSVTDLLKASTEHTVDLLRRELEIKKADLSEKLFFSSLEKIFIENRIYRDIEECETWESVIETIDKGLEPFKKQLLREVTEEDIIKLTEIKIKRISKYNSFKADELIRQLREEIEQVDFHLAHLTEYAINYFAKLKGKYGKGRERKTEIRAFDEIQVSQVAAANQKLYVNRKEGFIGYALKKDEFVSDCSDIDDIIVFRKDGKFLVTRISDKAFVGKDIIHVAVWKKNDIRMTYNMIYFDSKSGKSYAKRFNVTSITRDREYDLTRGGKDSKVLYFSANPNSESEIVTIMLSHGCKARKKKFDFDFGTIAVKGRGAQGNMVTRWPVRRVVQKEVGESTLGGIDIWYDPMIGRLNFEKRGNYLGKFDNGDLILVITKDGNYELTSYELTNRYDPDAVLIIEKFDPETVISAVHYDGENKNFYVKRFKISTQTPGKPFSFISPAKGSRLVVTSTKPDPVIEVEYLKGRPKKEYSEKIKLNELVDVKGWKARGNRLSRFQVTYVGLSDNADSESESRIPPEISGEAEQLNLFEK